MSITNTNNTKSIKNYTRSYVHIEVGADYFSTNYSSIDEKFTSVNMKAKALPIPELSGTFINNQHYLDSVDTLIESTYETEHRNTILFKNVLPLIKSPNSFLDIGVGNGDLTRFFGQYFTRITVIDTQEGSLKNLPDRYGIKNSPVIKIQDSILNENITIFQEKYDLILVSHVLYYIPESMRPGLLKNLHKLLNDGGLMVVIYNSGGDRFQLGKHFNHNFSDFSDLEIKFSTYHKVEVYESQELLITDNLEAMMHIAGVCLNDASASATREDLSNYLLDNCHYDNIFQIGMTQNIIIIGGDPF